MQRVVILGSTGSIGRQTLEIIAHQPEEYELLGLAAHQNIAGLAEQVRAWTPPLTALGDGALTAELARLIPDYTGELWSGAAGVNALAALAEADIVIQAMSGAAAILPTLAAIKAGQRIGLANKETLVAAGDIVDRELCSGSATIIPIDSEHAAIAQCLEGKEASTVERLWLTCSGGPFLHCSPAELMKVTPEQALKHPRWAMGAKITVDSATWMNKGLEVIEAHHLFQQAYGKIKVVIHPQSIVHSLVEFVDHSVLAQLGPPDMRLPIQHALTSPRRAASLVQALDLTALSALEFLAPDTNRFPALELAYTAGETGGTLPAVMNAANEEAVRSFLTGKIRFTDIVSLTRRVMEQHRVEPAREVEAVMSADSWARETFYRLAGLQRA
jgi:1-deoxy-D-xylulose-5-phosphate reductoisomerase